MNIFVDSTLTKMLVATNRIVGQFSSILHLRSL
jgi:hypothetical protein